MRLTPRPSGSRLVIPTAVKIKAINQVHKSSDIDGYNWPLMWDSHYDWTGWLKPGLDGIAGLGANTVKITGLGVPALDTGGVAFQGYLIDRMRKYLDYATGLGLSVYWQVNTRTAYGTTSQLVAAALANVRILADYPNVVGIDMWNEAPLEATLTAVVSFMSQVYPQAKSLSGVPVTVSAIDWPPPTAGTNFGFLTRLCQYVDFWDFHPYHKVGDATAYPQPDDLTAFRATTFYKPYLIGESGSPRSSAATGFANGSAEQNAHWCRLGVMSEQPDCLGVVGFSLTDYDSYQFGVFAETLATARPEMSGPFAGWRDVR